MNTKKNILITGGSGFIGQNLKEILSSKYTINSPNHQDLELTDEKLVEEFFKKNKIDVVIHCANIGGTRKTTELKDTFQINLRMFLNLLRCKKYYKKMIFLGSGAEYDKRQALVKVKETDFDKTVPVDDYGFYKYVCSRFIEKEKNIVNLRLFGIYGRFEDYEIRFISNSICKALLNLPITINKNVYFDYFYVKDFVGIIDYFISHKTKYQFYNIGRGVSIDLYSIAQKILRITKKELPIKINIKGINKEYACDIQRLKEEIPNFRCTDFDLSIKELIDYYQSRLQLLKKEDILKFG